MLALQCVNVKISSYQRVAKGHDIAARREMHALHCDWVALQRGPWFECQYQDQESA